MPASLAARRVTGATRNDGPNREKWIWAGRQAFGWFRHGYDPGLMVTKRYRPSAALTVQSARSPYESPAHTHPSTL